MQTEANTNPVPVVDALAAIAPVAIVVPFANLDDITLAAEMTAATVEMAKALDKAEAEVSGHGKAYGQRRAVLQFCRNVSAASLDKADKAAIGFADLASDAPSKRRLSRWHAMFRTLAEAWDGMEATDKAAILDGTSSFVTVYGNVKAKEREAAKAADKAAAAAAAEITVAKVEADANPPSLAERILSLASDIASASDEDLAACADALALLVETLNDNCNVVEAPEAEEIAAIAA